MYCSQKLGEDFAKFCGLLRISELYYFVILIFVHCSLQALFAMMEFTNRRAVDPNDFIAKLGLDPQVQQDAAEFSKLFISLLESSLSCQIVDEVRIGVESLGGHFACLFRGFEFFEVK